MTAQPVTSGVADAAAHVAAGAVELAVAGASVLLDPSGALYWPEQRLLAVADLHLEKGSSYAVRGTFLPPYDTMETLRHLAAVVARCRPERVVCLGDSFHDRRGAGRLPQAAREQLAAVTATAAFIWIAGNHDPDAPEGLGGTATAELAVGPLVFRHLPTAGAAPGEVAGHLHPSVRVALRGRSVRRRAFAATADRLVMPAFGAYTGGLNVLDPAFGPVFGGGFSAFALGARVHRLDPRQLVGG